MKKILLSCIFVCFINLLHAQSGGLDLSFGIKGIVKKDMGSAYMYNSAARQVLINGAGSIYILLNTTSVSKRFSNGSVDSSYGLDGFSTTISLTNANAALQPDGKMVIAGYLLNNTYAIVRISARGFMDSTFGTNGVQVITINPNAVAIQSNGKIVVAGTDENNIYIAVARYNTDGSVDNTFNGTGQQLTDFGNFGQTANAVAIQPDGKIIAAGTQITDSGNIFAIARYKIDGTPDNTFNGNGKQTNKIASSNDIGYSLAIQKDGKIVLAGLTSDGTTSQFALARYNTNGSLDNSFNGNGIKTVDIGSDMTEVNAVAIQSNSKIVVVGYTLNGNVNDFALVRLNVNGSLDNTFDKDGLLTTDIHTSDDYARSVAIQSNDKILVAGYSYIGARSTFAVARYNANGSLDATFNGNGKLEQDNIQGSTSFNATVVQPDGKILAAGRTWNGTDYDFAIARFNNNGTPDNSFSGDGKQVTDFGDADEAFSLALQPDGKIVVAGNSNAQFAVARYNTNGSLDNTFNGAGTLKISLGLSDVCKSVAIQADGKIVMAGYTYTDPNFDSAFFAVYRVNANGTPDNDFSGDAKQLTGFNEPLSFGNCLVIQSNGKIIVGGRSISDGQNNFAIARYNNNGSLDTTFSHDGKQNSVFGPDNYFGQTMALQNDGKIVIAGYSEATADNGTSFAVARYQLNGELDNTFSADGYQSTNIDDHFNFGIALAINNNGRIAVGGTNDNFTVVLYKSDGNMDSTFGKNGIQVNKIGVGNSRIQSLAFFQNKLYAAGAAQFPGTLGILARYSLAEGGPLAVSLVDFKAVLQNKAALLQWQTTGEKDLSGFSVERSTETNSFLPIGYVTANGNAALKNNYSITDRQPVRGINFYRLKMIDKNGKFTYSRIVSVTINDGLFTLQVFPNPAQNVLYVKTNGENEKATFRITDALGRQVAEIKMLLYGNTFFPVYISKLPKGVYNLKLQTETKTETKQFIKE